MRIRYFHHGLWPSASPSTAFVTYNCLGFSEQHADYQLVTVADTARPVSDVLARDFGIDQPLPVRLLRLGPFRRHHRVVHLVAFWRLLFARWDALITRNLGFLPWAVLLRTLRGGLVVFESHDFFSDQGLRGIPDGPTTRKQGRRERRWIPRVDGVVCVSEQQRQYYLQCYPGQRFLTAVAGVKPPRRPRPPRTGSGAIIGYLGTFDPSLYDFDLVFTALGMVTVPGARLVMAGGRGDADIEAMRARAARRGVADRVDVLPWQSPRELESLMERIDVGLAPLAITGRNRIGSPLKVLEYLSAGIPVIGSDLPGVRSLLGDDACGLVADEWPGSWAAAISRVLADPALAAALSANSVARAQELSWPRRAGRILAFLGELAAGRRPSASLASRSP
jgi:glycosyltransferase involved in cell wall biosynthesis